MTRALLLLTVLAACAGAPPTRVHRPEQGHTTISANGTRLAYFAAGDPKDPLIILLHGFPDTPHSWDPIRLALAADGYYVVSPFLRGYAPSQIPGEDDYAILTLGRDVLDLMTALGKHQADIVGHDWGAMAAYSAAAQEPRRIRRLVTMTIPHPANIQPRLRDARRLRHFLALKRRDAARKFAADDYAGVDQLYARWSPTWRSTPADREPVKNTFAAPGSLHGALGYYRDLSRAALDVVRAPTGVPALVIAGRFDATTPLDSFNNETAFTAGVRTEVLPTGHFPHRERPDLVLPLLQEFLGPAERPVAPPPPPLTPTDEPAEPTTAEQTWPLDLTRELPDGCLAWSKGESAALCVTGGGSIQSGHTYFLAFVGEHAEPLKIADWPALDLEDRPLALAAEDRPRVAARLARGNYVALPSPTAILTPAAPFVHARFTLRWSRKRTGHVDGGSGAWDIYQDRIEIACKTRNPIYLPILTSTIENPGKDDAAVYMLSPTQLLVHRADVWAVEGDHGARDDAAFVDLIKLGCR